MLRTSFLPSDMPHSLTLLWVWQANFRQAPTPISWWCPMGNLSRIPIFFIFQGKILSIFPPTNPLARNRGARPPESMGSGAGAPDPTTRPLWAPEHRDVRGWRSRWPQKKRMGSWVNLVNVVNVVKTSINQPFGNGLLAPMTMVMTGGWIIWIIGSKKRGYPKMDGL